MVKRRVNWLKRLGPGVITGAADDDPSGIATYSQSGAKYGTGMLWTVIFMLPLMVSVQEMAARIGIVTGKGIIATMKKHFPAWVSFLIVFLLFIANTANLGADLGAIAAAVQLLIPIPFFLTVVVVALVITFLSVFISYKKYASVLRVLTFSLFAYFVTGIMVSGDFRELFIATFVPHFVFDYSFVFLLVGVVGTTVSPYMMFWQANEEVEEELEKHMAPHNGASSRIKNFISNMRFDTWFGMIVSEVATWFIIMTTAKTLHLHGITDISTAAQAASALEPFAGHWATLLFAIGIIGTGLLTIPIFAASSAYALSELFGWKEGLNKKLKSAKPFYAVLAISTALGVVMNLLAIDPIKALVYVAVLNGVIAVPLIGILLLLGNNKKILGEHTNPLWVNIFGGITFVLMGIGAVLIFIPWR